MPNENSKANEIKRLTTPLTFKNSKAYDNNGNLITCVETLYDVRYTIEPEENILSDDEILKYAPQSKKASKIRLSRGIVNTSDILLAHETLPQIFGLYYIILICLAIPIFYSGMQLIMLVILLLIIIPLIYIYFIFNPKSYFNKKIISKKSTKKNEKQKDTVHNTSNTTIETLSVYEKEINNLKILFDVKEKVVRDLIKKKFEPPQITYDKFISAIDQSHKLFYAQMESALNIINLAAEDTPRIQDEIKNKIEILKTIINNIENLTNEIVITINNDDDSSEDVKSLLDEMENLIDSVKKY